MSSHREAPETSKDAVVDNTDVYAFVSPDRPDTVTLIANFIPFQEPAGGPNFYEFGDDVLYAINVDNTGDGTPDLSFQFRFTTTVRNPNTFLYNTGPITSLDSPNWNRVQTFAVHQVSRNGHTQVLGSNLACPPCNIGPLSTPDYVSLATASVHALNGGVTVFAGQRAEGFYVDLGAIFDLGDLRPFEELHAQYGMSVFNGAAPGVNTTNEFNVHSIAIQIPIATLVTGPSVPVIGVWASASRQAVQARGIGPGGSDLSFGPFVQVSRLGNPLFNEVIVPMAKKDYWNRQSPRNDQQFASYATKPELANLLPALYPGVFPNLDALNKSGKSRADLAAILLTGLPAGVVPGFQNYTGPTQADQLRLNTSIPPTAAPNILGLIGGDAAGFPNGRRVQDDVVTIELRAVAGLTYALVDKTYTPDAAAGAVTDGLTPATCRHRT